jgi:hypothetical protein
VEFNGSGWQLLEDQKWRVDAAALVHRIPSFGFVVKEAPVPGHLNVDKLKVLEFSFCGFYVNLFNADGSFYIKSIRVW